MPTQLTAGDKLVNDDGAEAEYFTAVPTLVHGAMHILRTAQGYVYRLTGDLENEFSLEGEPQTLAQSQTTSVADPSVMAELSDLKKMFAELMAEKQRPASKGVSTPILVGETDEDQDENPGDAALGEPEPAIGEPGAAAPAPVTPPANAIAF